jgi:hypothetical protein
VEALGTDEEGIEVASDDLEKSIGGSAPVNYAPALVAAQRLASDVAADQRLPAIPDSKTQSHWTTELSDLAVAAAMYIEGFTDDENGNASGGAALVQQANMQVHEAQTQGNELQGVRNGATSG